MTNFPLPTNSFSLPYIQYCFRLEAQYAHTTEPAPDAQPLPLVELVADAIAAQATSAGIVNDRPARAAIRAVAEWLAQNGKIALS